MKKVRKNLMKIVVTVMLLLCPTVSAYAAAPTISGISRTDYITHEQYEKILGTLRRMKDNISRNNYNFQSTGVRCETKEEADAFIASIKKKNTVGKVINTN